MQKNSYLKSVGIAVATGIMVFIVSMGITSASHIAESFFRTVLNRPEPVISFCSLNMNMLDQQGKVRSFNIMEIDEKDCKAGGATMFDIHGITRQN